MTEYRFIVCQKCGRATHYGKGNPELKWWLIGTRTDDGETPVIACPQHITVWALRMAGLGRGKAVMAWAKEAKEQDRNPFKDRPYVEPFPYPGEGSSDGGQ